MDHIVHTKLQERKKHGAGYRDAAIGVREVALIIFCITMIVEVTMISLFFSFADAFRRRGRVRLHSSTTKQLAPAYVYYRFIHH